jgi:signal peptidase I
MKKEGKNKFNFKKFYKTAKFILWDDDSFKGWIISIIFLLILIRLIIIPGLSFFTGTSLPLAIVESCSMHHKGTLFSDTDEWIERQKTKYEKFEIEVENFKEYPFKKGFTKGDILFITGVKPEKIEVGDVIIFNANAKHPIIHRVVEIEKEGEEYIFSTYGDNNLGQLPQEKRINEEQLVGKARANVLPYIGWIKLVFFEGIKEIDRYPETNFEGVCNEN